MKTNFYFLGLLSGLLLTTTLHAQNRMLTFDGVDDRATIPHHNSYDLGTGDFTVETWINIDATVPDGAVPILSSRLPGITGFILYVYYGNNLLLQMNGTSSQYAMVSTPSLHDGQCHHIAATRSGSTVKFYLDGVYKITATGAGGNNNMTSSGPIYLGYDVLDNYFLKGSIDEFRFWNVARSDANILSYYNTPVAINETGLIGYWTLDEGSGQSLTDWTATANTGVLGGTNSIESTDPTRANGCNKGTVTSIFDTKAKEDKLTVGPNPFNTETKITIDAEDANYTAEVYSIEGQLVQIQQISGSKEFQLGKELQPGMYILKVVLSSGAQTMRIVKK